MINKIQATVKSLQTCEILNITSFAFYHETLTMVSLELEDIKVGDKVILTAKPTSIAIAKEFKGLISHSNQLKGKLNHINYGQLLTDLTILIEDTKLSSIITTNLAKRMDLKKNDIVTCFIKASDLSIYKRLS